MTCPICGRQHKYYPFDCVHISVVEHAQRCGSKEPIADGGHCQPGCRAVPIRNYLIATRFAQRPHYKSTRQASHGGAAVTEQLTFNSATAQIERCQNEQPTS